MRDADHRWVGDVPVTCFLPDSERAPRGLIVWIPYLGGEKSTYDQGLASAAADGWCAVGVDPRRHGERRVSPADDDLLATVLGDFRAQMWPILGGTALDVTNVIDHALARHHIRGPVRVGGVSMGGDIAVTVAGIDARVERVAAVAATTEWTRPGMTEVRNPGRLIDQGNAPAGARWLYDHLNPGTHKDRFRRPLSIRFDLGDKDTHVPPASALEFQAAFQPMDEAAAPAIDVRLHPGADHVDVVTDPVIVNDALTWLVQ